MTTLFIVCSGVFNLYGQENSHEPTIVAALAQISSPELQESLREGLRVGPSLTESRLHGLLDMWRRTATGPSDGPEWYLVARLWRQAGVSDSAFAALERAAEEGDLPPGLALLEAARAAFLARRPDLGEEFYWEGCRLAGPVTLEGYWQDFAPVATPEEADRWAAIASSENRRLGAACDALRASWGHRAALAGLRLEERIALHYERLRYARQHYRLARLRTRLGPRTRLLSVQVGRREVDVDDRGLIYVRLGEPDDRASFSGSRGPVARLPSAVPASGGVPAEGLAWLDAARELQVSAECYHPNESWAYELPDGVRVFHFSPLEGTADWWLIENLHDVYRCGDPSAAVTLQEYRAIMATLSPAVGRRPAPIGRIAWLVLGDLYRSRIGLDPSYGALAQRIDTSGPADVADMEGLQSVSPDALALQGEFAEARQSNFDVAEETLTTVFERPDVSPDVPLLYELLQFRGTADHDVDKTRVWVNAIVEGEGLRGEPTTTNGYRYRVRGTFSAVGEDGNVQQMEALFSVNSPELLNSSAGVPVRMALEVSPGTYTYTLVVRDENDSRARPSGNWGGSSVRVRSYEARVPQLSDVAFAPDSGGSWTLPNGATLPITPVHQTDATGRAWVYFEGYGLSPTGAYRIEVTLTKGAREEPYTLTFQGDAPVSGNETIRRLLRLDLADAESGDYAVRIVIEDALGRRSLPLETDLRVRHQ